MSRNIKNFSRERERDGAIKKRRERGEERKLATQCEQKAQK